MRIGGRGHGSIIDGIPIVVDPIYGTTELGPHIPPLAINGVATIPSILGLGCVETKNGEGDKEGGHSGAGVAGGGGGRCEGERERLRDGEGQGAS